MPESVNRSFIISIYLALALSTLLVFWQVRTFDFVNYDDHLYVYENPHIVNGLTTNAVLWAFTTPHIGNWLPLTWLSFMLDCQLFGSNPGWMHLVNLILHLANTLLLFAVLKKMTDAVWPSVFVAAAFALHPMHVESVAWITERKDVLSTLFLLLMLAAYVGYVRRPTAVRYVTTLAIFVVGLLAKPMLVTLPFILLLLDYWPLKRFSIADCQLKKPQNLKFAQSFWRCIIEKIPFFILCAVSSTVTFLVQRAGGALADIEGLPLKARVANAFLSYVKYMGKMFWPQNLAVFYPYDANGFPFWQVVFCAVLLIIISVLTVRFGRKQKYLFVGWFWFIGTLIPVIGLIQSGSQAWADRYTYISYIGLFIMIAWGLPELLSKFAPSAVNEWPYRKIALGISVPIVLTALGICTYRQVGYWKNSSTLFLHALAVTRDNYTAHDCLADDLREHGKTALAIEHYKKALQIKPYYADSVNGIGMAMYDEGNLNRAIEYFQKALKLKPDSPSAHNNLGFALRKQGKLDEAVAHFTQAVQIDPDFVLARNNLADALILQNRLDEAIDQLYAILRLEPDSFFAHQALGSALLKKGSVNQAIEQFNAILKAEPNSANAHNSLGYALSWQGKLDEAVAHFSEAVKLMPDFAEARNNLANALKMQGRLDEAVAQFLVLVQLKPDWPAPMNDLAWYIATCPEIKNRDANEAIRLAGRACELTNYKNPALMGTLAASYAAAARFPEAIDTARKAIALADAANQPQIKNVIQYHLTLYTQGKPYIESLQKPLPGN